MTDSDGSNVVELMTAAERENQILALRLSGLSIRRLAHRFKLKEIDILDILDKALPPLSSETRVRLYREDIARIDDLLMAFYPQAKQGSATAAGICLKLLERRSTMCGTDAPVRLDVVVAQETADAPGSTKLLIAELERIAAERGGPRLDIEAEAEAPAGPPGPPAG